VLVGASDTAMIFEVPKARLGDLGRIGLPRASLFRKRKNEEVEA
jgi:hypothetical protein